MRVVLRRRADGVIVADRAPLGPVPSLDERLERLEPFADVMRGELARPAGDLTPTR